jgi:hypothetical protein
MSRLESFRRRLTAQIDGLNWAIEQASEIKGDFLELGLGNGRSYDHLRCYSSRRIWVVDRMLQCHPDCVPPKQDFLQGEADDMLEKLAAKGGRIALAHYDLGFGNNELDKSEAARLSPFIASVMVPDGVILSSQPLVGFTQIAGPDTIAPDRYMFYRMPE